MSMTGGISFFEQNKALFSKGALCVASSNVADENLILGTNKSYSWESIGSDDATPETLTITLDDPAEISRLFLIGHNFKSYKVEYWNGSAFVDFAGVTGLYNYADTEINETAFVNDTSYYEFTPVTTQIIKITAYTTQIADEQKMLNQVIVTNEIGTLKGFPAMSGIKLDRNDQRDEAISGRVHIVRGYESAAFSLDLSTYPYQEDIDILDELHTLDTPFIAWLCGGKPEQFRLNQRGFRAKDVYQMKMSGTITNGFYQNIYILGAEQQYSFIEVIQ